MTSSAVSVPVNVGAYLNAAPKGAEQAMIALGAAHSLTDELAVRLLDECGGISELAPSKFVRALHYSNFITPWNDGEWSFTPELRSWLPKRLLEDEPLMKKAHTLLQELSQQWQNPDETIPSYLYTLAGRAYHLSFLDVDEGLCLYRKRCELASFQAVPNGNLWLASVLAMEQRQNGVLPENAKEPAFLCGVILCLEGKIQEANQHLTPLLQNSEWCEMVQRVMCRLDISFD